MSRAKLPHQLTEEELLEQLQKEEHDTTAEVVDADDDILSFIAAFGITYGTTKVKIATLRSLYLHWSKNPIPKYAFSLRLGSIFEITKGKIYIHQNGLFFKKEISKWKSIKKRYKVKSPKWHNHFQAFLKHYNLKKGPVYIEGDMLYWLYDKWQYGRGKKSLLSVRTFGEFCLSYLNDKKRTPYSIMYGVSLEIYNHLSPETVLKFRTQKKEHWNETRKKINKKNSIRKSKEENKEK
jgi:hypothetical protein